MGLKTGRFRMPVYIRVLQVSLSETPAKLRPPDPGVALGRREMRRRRSLFLIFIYLINIDWGIIF